jgi:creatinine amidohydrolase
MTTDTIIARTLCDDVARICDIDVAPALAYSSSGEHAGFAGLLSIGGPATAMVLQELIRSARASWSAVVIVSGHGGNYQLLNEVVERARLEGDRVVSWLARDPAGDAHAGASETSVMLSIDPEVVRLDLVTDSVARTNLPDNWMHLARTGGIRAISESGVLGDPRGASAQRGWELRRRWCGEVVSLIEDLEESA